MRARPLFQALSDSQWDAISAIMHNEIFGEQEQILAANNETIDLFWIDAGEVMVQRETPFGTQMLAKLGPDDAFGEIAMIDGKGHTADVVASAPARIRRLEGHKLKELFSQDHTLACHFFRYFWANLAEKIHLANNQLAGFFAGDPNADAARKQAPKEDDAKPGRPAWFAPPEGGRTESGSEIPATPSLAVPTTEKREALQTRGLSSSEIDLLFARGEELHVNTEEAIFHEGDFGDTLYFILKGEVRISKDLPGVGPEALAILEAGEIFGEMALVSENATRSADCLAHENPVLLLAFRLNVLNTIKGEVATDYSFLQALCKMMAHRIREINDKLVSWKMMRGGFF